MNRKITALVPLAVLSAGALVLTGCTAGASPSPTASGSVSDLPLIGWTPVDPGTLTQGGTLNLAVSESGVATGNWNPNTAEGAEVDLTAILAPTTGGPYKAKQDGSVEIDPDYATDISLVSDSPQVVDVKLNPKAVWEDGTPITAKDYQATYAALSGKDESYDLASSAGFDKVSDFTVVSDTEFKVTFAQPYADWQAVIGQSAVPAAIASDSNAWNTGYVEKALPSNGPFVISTYDTTADSYTETVNPNWWGAKPKLDKITFKVIGDQSAQAQAFANGELDAIDNVGDVDTLTASLAKSGAVKEFSGGLSWSQVTFNGKDPVVGDVALRKAIAQAIDRQGMATAANDPLGVPGSTDGNYVYMPGQNGYEDTIGDAYPYDLDAAKKTLTDAGYTQASDGSWNDKSGQPLKLSIIYPQGSGTNQARGQQIQASLAQIGLKVDLSAVPSNDYFTDIMNGQYQMATFGWSGTLYPVSSAESLFYPAQDWADQAGQNFAFITDDSLGDAFDAANAELDPSKRVSEVSDINKKIAAYLPMIPIYTYPNISVVDGKLANYGPATFAAIDWTAVGYTK